MTEIYSSRYLIDTLGFETHMKQIRAQRGEQIPNAWYQRPYFYALRLDAGKIRAHREPIQFPSFVEKKDYEFEIAGMHLKPVKTGNLEEAVAHMRDNMVFCIMNDCSCRDFQAEDSLLPLGVTMSKGIADKAFSDPWVYGSDLNMDENGVFDLDMCLSVNGTSRCITNFKSIYFNDPETGAKRNWSFAEVIAWFGRMNQGFEEGDILGSGTVGNGCIAEHADQYPWLKFGDEITMRVESLGILRNIVEVMEMPAP